MNTAQLPDSAHQAALDRYNAHFDPRTFRAFQTAITADLLAHDGATDDLASFWMNLLTDAALDACGYPPLRGACLRLAAQLGLHPPSSDDAIRAAAAHLARFAGPGDAHADDLLATARALAALDGALDQLEGAIRPATDGHTARHRAATRFLEAAHDLTRAAQILLAGDDLHYAAEKAARGAARLRHGGAEAVTLGEDGRRAFGALAGPAPDGSEV